MSSTYSLMVGGTHPMGPMWLAYLRIDPTSIDRFRDAYIVDEGVRPRLHVVTRSGDNTYLEAHSTFIERRHALDNYWTYDFRLPDEIVERVNAAGKMVRRPRWSQEAFDAILARISQGKTGHGIEITEEDRQRALDPLVSIATELELRESPSRVEHG